MKIGITVVVITKNEEHNIDDCLKSVSWADEIIVVDAESKDLTVERAKKFTEKIFVQPWLGFAAAKQFAVHQATHEWIFWIDADERAIPDLSVEIQETIKKKSTFAAFTVARRAYFLGKWIKHSGWYPGRVPRLFHKGRAVFNDAAVHEGLDIRGSIGELQYDLLHFTDPNIFHYFSKFNRYTTLASKELKKKNKKFKSLDLVIHPLWQFLRMYFLRRGFLDGVQGLILALFSSAYVFTKYAKLWEIEKVQYELEQKISAH